MTKNMTWLKTSLIAHRGYFDHQLGIPENSILSCERALAHGYGIEIDIQMTKDQHVVLFHDDDLLRMTKKVGQISDFTYDEIKSLRLLDTLAYIPKLSEALAKIEGKTPLLIELKPSKNDKLFAEKTYDIIKDYQGEIAIFSFHPGIVYWFKKHAPHIIRGQISSYFNDYPLSSFQKFLMKRMIFNPFTKPDFISYHIDDLPNKYLDNAKKKGLTIISYAAKNQSEFDHVKRYYDNVVFEGFAPK
jgi:glycerophosphoryl diester phosphodiesterase